MSHTVKCFGTVNKAEIDVSLELSRFFNDPGDAGNLISDSSTFSKTSLKKSSLISPSNILYIFCVESPLPLVRIIPRLSYFLTYFKL